MLNFRFKSTTEVLLGEIAAMFSVAPLAEGAAIAIQSVYSNPRPLNFRRWAIDWVNGLIFFHQPLKNLIHQPLKNLIVVVEIIRYFDLGLWVLVQNLSADVFHRVYHFSI